MHGSRPKGSRPEFDSRSSWSEEENFPKRRHGKLRAKPEITSERLSSKRSKPKPKEMPPPERSLQVPLQTFVAFENIVRQSPLQSIVEGREWLDLLTTTRTSLVVNTILPTLKEYIKMDVRKMNKAIEKFKQDAQKSNRPLRELTNNELRKLAADPTLVSQLYLGEQTYSDHVRTVLENAFSSLRADWEACQLVAKTLTDSKP